MEDRGRPPPARGAVRGLDTDAETRCAHYRGPDDRVAIRFRCCDLHYACHACHEALEDHVALRWPPDAFHRRAVLCGACRSELTIREYLAGGRRCPCCGAGFNPRCADHRHLYFETGGSPANGPP